VEIKKVNKGWKEEGEKDGGKGRWNKYVGV